MLKYDKFLRIKQHLIGLSNKRVQYDIKLTDMFFKIRIERLEKGYYDYEHLAIKYIIENLLESKKELEEFSFDRSLNTLETSRKYLKEIEKHPRHELFNILLHQHAVDIQIYQSIKKLKDTIKDIPYTEQKLLMSEVDLFLFSNSEADPERSYISVNQPLVAMSNSCVYPNTLYRTKTQGAVLDNQVFNVPFKSDAVQIDTTNGISITNNVIKDPILNANECNYLNLSNKAHRDAIQISILPTAGSSDKRDRFAAAESKGIHIDGNKINSIGKLQGIFSSDGLHHDLVITNNIIDTNSSHKISINGMVSGSIQGNNNNQNVPSPIQLKPLRFGGNSGYLSNIWALSLREHNYQSIIGASVNSPDVDDLRQTLPDGLGYDNFPLKIFTKKYNSNDTTMNLIETQSAGFDWHIQSYILAFFDSPRLLNYYLNHRENTPLFDITETNLRCAFIQELVILIGYIEYPSTTWRY